LSFFYSPSEVEKKTALVYDRANKCDILYIQCEGEQFEHL